MFHGGIYHIFRARVPSRVCGGARCVSRVPVGVSPIGMPREGVGIRIIRSSKREGTNQSLELENFRAFGTSTAVNHQTVDSGQTIAVLKNEFWTSKQRAASSLREVSYRACFKPQLPRFFIERLTQPGDLVYDPFMGRGTTLLEAMLLGRRAAGCDINPQSAILLSPRLDPPRLEEIYDRLTEIYWDRAAALPEDLLVFYHPQTLRQICALREALHGSSASIDGWIRMVATNRLSGHSKGFFSVYTLPPNQAVSIESQRRINEQRKQAPDPRDVAELIRRYSGGGKRRAETGAGSCERTDVHQDLPLLGCEQHEQGNEHKPCRPAPKALGSRRDVRFGELFSGCPFPANRHHSCGDAWPRKNRGLNFDDGLLSRVRNRVAGTFCATT
ncbi:MAG: DNA methyltransferase [Terrimicrobiaceae bacterium]